MSDEDRSSYEEGVRRGGVLLTAHVDESRAGEAIRILDREGTVDMDQREQSWRGEGWQAYQGSSQRSALGQSSMTGGNQTERSAGTHQEEHIPIIEEQLRVASARCRAAAPGSVPMSRKPRSTRTSPCAKSMSISSAAPSTAR